jgi:hypothetical protein
VIYFLIWVEIMFMFKFKLPKSESVEAVEVWFWQSSFIKLQKKSRIIIQFIYLSIYLSM